MHCQHLHMRCSLLSAVWVMLFGTGRRGEKGASNCVENTEESLIKGAGTSLSTVQVGNCNTALHYQSLLDIRCWLHTSIALLGCGTNWHRGQSDCCQQKVCKQKKGVGGKGRGHELYAHGNKAVWCFCTHRHLTAVACISCQRTFLTSRMLSCHFTCTCSEALILRLAKNLSHIHQCRWGIPEGRNQLMLEWCGA